jgi:SAM-dependent methyltransferase
LLHADLQGKCKELIGIDLDKSAIEVLREVCHITDTIYGNAEELDKLFPAGRFDTIIAGDVVEHMSNVGLFFNSARKVLKPGGELIITVPNAFSIKRILGAILLRQERNNPDHLYFFSAMTLRQAAHRFGYDLSSVSGFMYNAPECGLNKRGTAIARVLIGLLNNNYLADELAVVLKPMAEKLY